MAEYLKIPEVARRLDVSEKTVRRYIKSGALPSTFIGGAYRITEEDLEEYIHRAEVKPETPKVESRSSLEPSLFNGLEGERRKEKYLPWLEFADRYNERWHEKARRAGLTRGEILECRDTLRDLAPIIGRLTREEEHGLSPGRRQEVEGELIMWQAASLLMGALERTLHANKKLFDESEIAQFTREREQLQDLGKAANE